MQAWQPEHDSLKAAAALDSQDPLRGYRDAFVFPQVPSGRPLYFAGHSLGLMPKKAREYVDKELENWGRLAVQGHVKGQSPWLPYHERVTGGLARLIGAKPNEVVGMNSLTVNLHLALVSFYCPTAKRDRILIENNTFPSDKYAVDSQARWHGKNAEEAVVELQADQTTTVSPESVLEQIERLGEKLSLVLLGNCNYLSGQRFDFAAIARAAHRVGALVGFNLAHGIGNLELQLHDWNIDFAVWCSYKYLNAGPGGIAGLFIHERHLGKPLPRLEGWWGHNKKTRFKMEAVFDPIPTVEAWQLSNPPILPLAALAASLEIFDAAGMTRLRQKGDTLTDYLEWLIRRRLPKAEIVTPPLPHRGSMIALRLKDLRDPLTATERLAEQGLFLDFRQPDILRLTPAPLYNSFQDVFQLVQVLEEQS